MASVEYGRSIDGYAAEALPDGRIKVTFQDLNASPEVVQRRMDELERRLGTLGVMASIDYIPFFHRCSVFPRGAFHQEDNLHPAPVAGPDEHGDDAIIYIYPDRIKRGRTLVMTLSMNVRETSSAKKLSAYLVRGPAKPCNPVPVRSG